MQSNYNKFFLWHARQALEQVGVAGVAGLGLLVFCGMYYFSALRPLQREVGMLRREYTSAQFSPATSQQVRQPADQLQTFYATFPSIDTAPDVLDKLHDEALAQGVVLDQGEYNLARNQGDKLVRYGVALPLKGDYLHVRKFLAQTLVDIPYISLDGVEFQRQKISEATLEARVKMTIFLVDH